MKRDIAGPFWKEFEAYLDCLKETVEFLSDTEWIAGSEPRKTPVHQVCHAVSGMLNCAGTTVDHADIRFGWKPPKEYPSRSRLVELIGVAGEEIHRFIQETADRTLADRDWHVPPLLKLVYLYRHSVWHLCCLREQLRDRGLRPPKFHKSRWRPRTATRSDGD